jgi:hypothetical protein
MQKKERNYSIIKHLLEGKVPGQRKRGRTKKKRKTTIQLG